MNRKVNTSMNPVTVTLDDLRGKGSIIVEGRTIPVGEIIPLTVDTPFGPVIGEGRCTSNFTAEEGTRSSIAADLTSFRDLPAGLGNVPGMMGTALGHSRFYKDEFNEHMRAFALAVLGSEPPEEEDVVEALLGGDYKTVYRGVKKNQVGYWQYRLITQFYNRNGWVPVGGWEPGDLVTEIESGELVPGVGTSERMFYNESRNLVMKVCLHPFELYLNISYLATDSSVDRQGMMQGVIDLLEDPFPFDGLVTRISEEGISRMEVRPDTDLTFSPDARTAADWITSLADPAVRDNMKSLGLPVKAGLLVDGPPGTGKSTLVRDMIRSVSGSDTTVIYVSADTEISALRDFVSKVKNPPLVVIEDAENFIGDRGSDGFTDFLNFMDGVEESVGMMVVATTNDSSGLDPAAVRSGRLERQLTLDHQFADGMVVLFATKFGVGEDVATRVVDAMKVAVDRFNTGNPGVPDENGDLPDPRVLTPAVVDYGVRSAVMSGHGLDDVDGMTAYLSDVWVPFFTGDSFL